MADFEAAIERIETRLGLEDQARAIVFHEKEGRRHAHVVWSRIDVLEMKAIKLPYFKTRLKDISKDLFLEHGWRLPDGYLDRSNRDPRNFTLAEWQQAKRQGKDARDIKRVFQEAWSISDTRDAFANALAEKGYVLARGDRRGFVAVDAEGEVYAVPKWVGQKTKEVREKLGDPKDLRSVDQAKAYIAKTIQPALSRWQAELAERERALKVQQEAERRTLVTQQRKHRQELVERLERRRIRDARQRQTRFQSGLRGLWDRLRGEHGRIRKENERDAWEAHLRDQRQKDDAIFRHLEERRAMKRAHSMEQSNLKDQSQELALDRERFEVLRSQDAGLSRDGPDISR